MLKKLPALLLAGILCLALAACGDPASDSTEAPSASAIPPAASETEPAGTESPTEAESTEHTGDSGTAESGEALTKMHFYSVEDEMDVAYDCTVGDGIVTITFQTEERFMEGVYQYDPAGYQGTFFRELYYDYMYFPYLPKEFGNPISELSYPIGDEDAVSGRRFEYEGNTMKVSYIENGVVVKLEESGHDANGITTKMTITDVKTGSVTADYTYLCSYDEEGRTVKVAYGGGIADDERVLSYPDHRWLKLEYDSAGNILCITEYLEGEAEYRADFAYNADGNLIKKTVTTIDEYVANDYYSCMEFEYDGAGRTVRQSEYDSDGTPEYYTEYIYG